MKLLKKSIYIIKNEGFKMFFKKGCSFLLVQKNSWIRLKRKEVIREIKNFTSDNIDEVVNFAFNKFWRSIRPMQTESELKELLKIFQEKRPKRILEIGTAKGGTLFCFAKLAPDDALIISIDLPGGKFGGGYPEWKIQIYQAFKKENQKLYLLREDSHKKETLEKVKTILNGEKIDFLFMDGDHTLEGVKKDFEMYSQLVEKNGLIAFHDIVEGSKEDAIEVPVFWQEIKNNFKHQEIVEDWNRCGTGIGVILKK